MARRLELDPPRLTGDPVVVAEQVHLVSGNGFANISLSGNGVLFYGRGNAEAKGRFGWRDRTGKLLETIGQPVENRVGSFALSPDGSRVAYAAGSEAGGGLGAGPRARRTLPGHLQQRRVAALGTRREAALLQPSQRHPPESGRWVG